MTIKLHIATKKGAFQLSSPNREEWTLSEPHHFGQIIYHTVPDPRNPDIVIMASKTGHLGPTIFRSTDGGQSWEEAEQPPAFNKEEDKSVNFIFWITPGHTDDKGVWWAGTSPQGLFRSSDNGETWQPFDKFNKNDFIKTITKDNMGTPIGPLLHSINIDPSDKNRIILAMSSGGAFETTDYGENWRAFNQNVLADFLPDPYPETGQCVHNMQLHSSNPNIVYQQGHCGVYRIDMENDEEWTRIGENMPSEIGDAGFPLVLHPRDPERLWIIPMDGTDVWPRTSVDGKPAVYHSRDGGNNWIRQDKGFPQENAYFTVLRQAFARDDKEKVGLYLGNKSGEVWASIDEGETWRCIARYLPDIYAIEVSSE